MQDTITTLFCVCSDFLSAMGHSDNEQARLFSAEVMLVPLVGAYYFGGKMERAQTFLVEHGYFKHRLSKSRLNRRVHALPLSLWQNLFDLLGAVFKANNTSGNYTIDSMPLPVCDNIRISRCRLFRGQEY